MQPDRSPTLNYPSLPLAEMEARITRFEERVSAAQQKHPPTKQWVRQALRRQGAARCAVRIKRLSLDIIARYGDKLADLFCQYPDDVVFAAPYELGMGFQPRDLERQERLTPVRALLQAARWVDEWGTTWAHAFGGVGATSVAYPIQNWSQLDAYLSARIPDPFAAGRLDGLRSAVAMHGQTKYIVGVIHLALFERMHMLRGMENLFEDFYAHPREVHRLAEAVADYTVGMVRAMAQAGVDAVFLTDDWGSQTALMISLPMWREFFAAHYRRIFAEAHRHGLEAIFHSCGNVTDIVSDLIELGADGIDPLQPEAMDIAALARRFGGRVAFCGGISDQELVAYTPAQVRAHVRQAIATLGQPCGHAYIVAPSNILPPEIPLENLQALFEAAHQA